MQRAFARSLCAEMHSGFMNLRQQFSFTLKSVPKATLLSDDVKQEIARIEAIFELAELPYMFEFAGAVDAFYAILAYRLKSYGINLKGKAGEYQRSLLKWNLLKQAIVRAEEWEKSCK